MSVHWKKFEKFLLHIGCRFSRQKGSHRIYTRKGLIRPIVVPQKTDLSEMVIRSNLRVLGIEYSEFLSILDEL